MKLVIHGIASGKYPKLRTYVPEDPELFDDHLLVSVGQKHGKGSDDFTIRVATPRALAASTDDVVAHSPLLVLRRFDYDVMFDWLERTVASCQADTWPESVERLQRHFHWEFAGIK